MEKPVESLQATVKDSIQQHKQGLFVCCKILGFVMGNDHLVSGHFPN